MDNGRPCGRNDFGGSFARSSVRFMQVWVAQEDELCQLDQRKDWAYTAFVQCRQQAITLKTGTSSRDSVGVTGTRHKLVSEPSRP
jgi:hypothetical protein